MYSELEIASAETIYNRLQSKDASTDDQPRMPYSLVNTSKGSSSPEAKAHTIEHK